MIKKVYLSYSQCPESCWHIIQARAQGQPSILTYCRDKKTIKSNRRKSTRKLKSCSQYDRDEYPFACTYEGGSGADVIYIDPSDNRRSGSIIGHQLRNYPDGTKFIIIITY